MVELRAIAEDNFLDAFRLELAPGQERFVSHPIRSLAQAYVYREQCQPFGIYADGKMSDMSWSSMTTMSRSMTSGT